MGLAQLTRELRRSLGLTQEEFAARLESAGSTVRNWESGRKRPSPEFLKKIAELAPAFAGVIAEELKNYEWHPADAGRELNGAGFQEFLDDGKRQAIADLAKRDKKELAETYAELITLGLQARLDSRASALKSHSGLSSKEFGEKVRAQLRKKREAHARAESQLRRKPA